MKQIHRMLLLTVLIAASSLAFQGCETSGHEHHHASANVKAYPLKTCLVSGEGFDHGKPFIFVHEGQEIQLCCKDCKGDFDKNPAKFLQKLTAAK